MKKYKVTGWYRYGDNEKDFEVEEIEADSYVDALKKFQELFINYKFFNICLD